MLPNPPTRPVRSRRKLLHSTLEALETRIAPATFTVTTTADSGAGSLRAAITSANLDAVADSIVFNLAGPGVHTIQLQQALPTITNPLTIDGTTEPGFTGVPVVELDGTATIGANGLFITAAGVSVKGLIIGNFDNSAISVAATGSNFTVQGCWLGVDATATIAHPNGGSGLFISAPGAVIGGATALMRNVIAGNGGSGIFLNGASATGAVIKGNYIGTNQFASLEIPNGGYGISITTGGGHIIGGSAAGEGNVISGNTLDDIDLFNSNNNTIAGNVIGLDLPMKVELQSGAHGIEILGTSSGNLVGGTAPEARNVIAAHDEGNSTGINIIGTGTGNTVLGNLIGTNPAGDNELNNTIGILVSMPGTVIGDLSGHGNLIAGNSSYGIEVTTTDGVQILGNRVGLYTTGTDLTLGNGSHGIFVTGANNVTLRGNVIGGNGGDGLRLDHAGNPIVQGNKIGTDGAGAAARPNAGSGIYVLEADGLTIGGSATGQGNLISANGGDGIYLSTSHPASVLGNIIGLDAAAVQALGNTSNGIEVVAGGGHIIGGKNAGEGNVISGNAVGVRVATDGNFVQGNIIGLNGTATAVPVALTPAGAKGVLISAGAGNTIGGSAAGEGNLIAGLTGTAVTIGGSGSGNKILGNLIGTNAASAANLGNGGGDPTLHTLVITAPGTTVGGPAGARNVIAGGSGYALSAKSAANLRVENNYVGLGPDGATLLPNGSGLTLSGPGTVNAVVVDNVVAGSGSWGILVSDISGVSVQHNRVGVIAAGTAAVGSLQWGIYLQRVSNVTVGGSSPVLQGNQVGGTKGDAILVNGATAVTIEGNAIGLDATGSVALPNGEGISVNSTASAPIKQVDVLSNDIAGTKDTGINLSGAHVGTRVQSNVLGLAQDGVTPLPNNRGIAIGNGSGILLGGDATQGNMVAWSKTCGIGIYFAASHDIQVESNTLRDNTESGITVSGIGGPITVGAPGSGNLMTDNVGPGIIIDTSSQVTVVGNGISGNGGAGVLIKGAAQQNIIGGSAAGAANTISGNGAAGVQVTAGSGTRITQNLIFGNTGLPIDLGPAGPTANDDGDLGTGANGLQNAPQLTGAALLENGHTEALGLLQSTPNTSFRVEFFSGSTTAAHAFLMQTDLTTDAQGNAPIALDLGVLPAGAAVIASATSLVTGETSELGGLPPAAAVPTISIDHVSVTEGNAGTLDATFSVTLSAVAQSPVTVDYSTLPGSAKAGLDFTAVSGTLTFPAGTTLQTITVPVLGDTLPEAAEMFQVLLANAQGGLVVQDAGTGTILNDDTNLVIDAKHKVAKWRDLDGDLATLTSSKGILTPDDFVFLADGAGGEQLAALLLSDDGPAAAKTKITLKAKRDPAFPQGDGHVNLGLLDATGLDLGSVNISGDLGKVLAGDANPATPGVASLTAGSFGAYGLTTQSPGANLHSYVIGKVGKLTVRGDLAGGDLNIAGDLGRALIGGSIVGGAVSDAGSLHVFGTCGPVKVGGSILGGAGVGSGVIYVQGALSSLQVGGSVEGAGSSLSGTVLSATALGAVIVQGDFAAGAHLVSGGSLGSVKIRGEVAGLGDDAPALIQAAGSIAGVTVGGSVTHARIAAGYDTTGLPVNPDASVGAVKVADNWIASTLVAGLSPGADGAFGTGDDTLAVPVSPYLDQPDLVARIAAIRIGGRLGGSPSDPSAKSGFFAQEIGKFTLGTVPLVLNPAALDTLTLTPGGKRAPG